jgi:hypothetical protein
MTNRVRNSVLIGLLLVIVIALGAWYFFTKPRAESPPTAATSTPVAIATNNTAAPAAPAAATHIIQSGTYYTADLQYPSQTPLASSAEANVDASIVQVLKKFSQDTLTSFIQNGHFDTLTASDAADQGLTAGQKFSISDGYTEYSGAHTISYVFNIYENTLGAHPVTMFQTFTFNNTTGQQITLADLFAPQSNYLDQLSSISRTMLTKQLGSNADPIFINAGTTATSSNFSSFAIDGSNLVLIFPPYKVAPGALGAQTLRIPLSQLQILSTYSS